MSAPQDNALKLFRLTPSAGATESVLGIHAIAPDDQDDIEVLDTMIPGEFVAITIGGIDVSVQRLSEVPTIGDAIAQHWHDALEDNFDVDHAQGLLFCEADSVCGRAIIELCNKADALLACTPEDCELKAGESALEHDVYADIEAAVLRQACVILFG
jgi:hypothetical protein